jgi:hypothetical protein
MPTATKFFFRTEVCLHLTEAEVDRMIQCSRSHYDWKCQSASKQGGFLYGWKNHFTCPETLENGQAEVWATWDEMDTLCKILEQEYLINRTISLKNMKDSINEFMADPKEDESPLYRAMIKIFKQMAAESKRVNPK